VVGYFVLELHATSTHVINLAIHPDYRRRGYASRCLGLIQKIALRTLEMAKARDANLHPLGSRNPRSLAQPAAAAKELQLAEKADGRPALVTGEIFLEVEESNLPAQLLYKKFGFRATKILPNYYPTFQEDGYLMRRDI
jgi:ribosomal protein S18 acetylase RimI-like enzyme